MTTSEPVSLKHLIAHWLGWNRKKSTVLIENGHIYDESRCETCDHLHSKEERNCSKRAIEYKNWRIVRIKMMWHGIRTDGLMLTGQFALLGKVKKEIDRLNESGQELTDGLFDQGETT